MSHTYTIKSTKQPKVIEQLLSLCRRKLYSVESIFVSPTQDNQYFEIKLTVSKKNKDKAQKLTNHIKKIVEILEVK